MKISIILISFLISGAMVSNQPSKQNNDNGLYQEGRISIVKNTVNIKSNQINISLKNGTYYKDIKGEHINYILFDNGKLDKNNIRSISFAEVQNEYKCSVDYIYNSERKLIVSNISENEYNYLVNNSIDISSITEEEKENLFTFSPISSSYVTTGYQQYDIPQGTYDSYTDNNGIIYEYDDAYSDMINGKLCEDRIVDLVPKELFSQLGSGLYIGEEYGFFINTGFDNYVVRDYCSDVFVFDIIYNAYDKVEYENMSTPNSDISITVKPMFQYRYATRLRENNSNFNDFYVTNDDRIVVLNSDYNLSNYYLKDIRFTSIVQNANELNIHETGYNNYNDNGEFISNVSSNIVSTSYRTLYQNSFNFLTETVKYSLGFVKYLGTLLSTAEYFSTINDIFSSTNDDCVRIGYGTNEHHYTSRIDQINNYSELIKATEISSDANSLFTSRASDTVFNGVITTVRETSSHGFPTYVDSGISLSIYGKPSAPCIADSTVQTVNTSSRKFNRKERQYSPLYISQNNLTVSNFSIKSGGFETYRFTPSNTKEYLINASNSNNSITVMDSFYRIIDYSNSNELSVNLISNKTYYIKLSNNSNNNRNYSLCLIENGVQIDTVKDMYIDFDEEKEFHFYPSETKTYNISLTCDGGDADPELYLYDSNGNLIAYNDDYNGDVDSCIITQLVQSNIYTIKCKMASEDYCGTLHLLIS